MDAAKNLSKNIIAIRNLRNLTQVEFSKELGISKSTLQEIEQGRSPNLNTVECMSARLGIPTSVLLSDTLPAKEMSILIHMLQLSSWYSGWSRDDQENFLSLICQSVQIISRYSEQTPPPAVASWLSE